MMLVPKAPEHTSFADVTGECADPLDGGPADPRSEEAPLPDLDRVLEADRVVYQGPAVRMRAGGARPQNTRGAVHGARGGHDENFVSRPKTAGGVMMGTSLDRSDWSFSDIGSSEAGKRGGYTAKAERLIRAGKISASPGCFS